MIKLLFCAVLLTACGQSSSKPDEAGTVKTKTNSATTETVNDSQFIDNYIINAIIDHYKSSTTKMETEKTDTLLNISFRNIPSEDDAFDGIGLRIYISKMKKDYIFGDIDNDGVPDLIVSIDTEGGGGGGNVYWNDLFVFLSKNGKFALTSFIDSPEVRGCRAGQFFPDKIENGLILGNSFCFAENDPHCCPSLEYLTTITFDGKQLKYKSQRQTK